MRFRLQWNHSPAAAVALLAMLRQHLRWHEAAETLPQSGAALGAGGNPRSSASANVKHSLSGMLFCPSNTV